MPKVIARQRNNKIRSENDLKEKNKNTKNDDKISKKQMERIKDAYICPFKQKSRLISCEIIDNERKRDF